MKLLFKSLLLFTCLTSISIPSIAMEWNSQPNSSSNSSSSSSSSKSKTTEITVQPFFSTQVDHIPKYVYENCNQVTKHNWNIELFERLKKAVANIKRQQLLKNIQL